GGRSLGLSPQMPAWGSAFTDEEVGAIVAYVKTLAPGSERYPPAELNLMLPIRTQKAFPEDEIVWKSRYADQDGEDVWRNVLEFEKRFGRRGQGILELVEENGTLTEVEVGWKHALTWSLERGYLLSGGAKLAVPTEGDATEELIPFLAWAQELSPKATLQASARAVLPFDDVDAGEFELGGRLGLLGNEEGASNEKYRAAEAHEHPRVRPCRCTMCGRKKRNHPATAGWKPDRASLLMRALCHAFA
ncbi:MAG: c-type cytochrome, partial [Gammaproteobacteria bacterium]